MERAAITTNAFLVVDKPNGWTSNDVVQKVKRLVRAKKVGHTGTLDPAATGVLVLCLNRATKQASTIMGMNKSYHAWVKFGVSTDTGDAEGQIVDEAPVPELSREQLSGVLAQFNGSIEQTVPLYSAVKVDGKRLYRYARKNQAVERPKRTVEITALELLSYENAVLEFMVSCSSGTYIRTLAEDIGLELDLPAHLSALRRTQVGPYGLNQALSIEQIAAYMDEGGEGLLAHLDPIKES